MSDSFTKINNSFIERMAELSGSAVKVYLFLRKFADWDGEAIEGKVWPSSQSAKQATGLSHASYFKAINELLEKGWIKEIQRRFNSSNVYEFGDGTKPNLELLENRKEQGKKYARKGNSQMFKKCTSSEEVENEENSLMFKNYTSGCSKNEPLDVQKIDTNENQLTRYIERETVIQPENFESPSIPEINSVEKLISSLFEEEPIVPANAEPQVLSSSEVSGESVTSSPKGLHDAFNGKDCKMNPFETVESMKNLLSVEEWKIFKSDYFRSLGIVEELSYEGV